MIIYVVRWFGDDGYSTGIHGLYTSDELAKSYLTAFNEPDSIEWRDEKGIEYGYSGDRVAYTIECHTLYTDGDPVSMLATAMLEGDPQAIDLAQDVLTRGT
jgi:hypothetical protein